jgi:hypothetical protein
MRRFASRHGTVSLVLALVAASGLIVMGIFLQGARIRAAEANVLRCVDSSSRIALSTYGGALLQRYGIFAVDTGRSDSWRENAVHAFDESKVSEASACRLEVLALDSLGDREVLAAAIRNFVGDRLPALIIAMGIDKLSGIGRQAIPVSFDPLFDTGGEEDSTSGSWGAALLELAEKSGSSEEAPYVSPDDPSYDIGDASQDMSECLREIQAMNRMAAEDPTRPSLPSPLDPASMIGFLSETMNGLPASVEAILDEASLDIYATTMFRSRVLTGSDDGVSFPYTDLRGRAISSLACVDLYEAERIVAGRNTDAENLLAVERRILAIRFAFQMVSQLSDESCREKAQALAAVLSGLLSAATSGALVIPTGFLAIALQAAWAFQSARSEVQTLVEGGSVPFLPEGMVRNLPELAQWKAAYSDHLTLLLLAVPTRIKLERIASIIEKNIALFGSSESSAEGKAPLSGYATRIVASTWYRGDMVSRSTGFYDDAAR